MSYVTAHRDAAGRYPGIGRIAGVKLTPEECEKLLGDRINPNAYIKPNSPRSLSVYGAQEAVVIDAGTGFDRRIEKVINVGTSIPVRPVIELEEQTYGTRERKYYVARISKMVHGADHMIDLLSGIDFLVAGDIQVDPDTIYTVFAYNHKTRKMVIAPLGE